MHEIPKPILDMWAAVNRDIDSNRAVALNTERLYFEVRNWLPPASTLSIPGPGFVLARDWPQDLDPNTLIAALGGNSGRRYQNFLLITCALGMVEIQFAPYNR